MTCTYVLDEIVNYYNKNNTKVYALLLDASKAFDRVHYLKLYHTLVAKEMCPSLLGFLINLYISQTMSVASRNTLSDHFSVSNGVKPNVVHFGNIVGKTNEMTELTHVSLNLTADLMFYYQHLSMQMPM